MSTNIVTSIKGTVIRTIKLDVCGNPVSGGSGVMIVEPGFISLKPSPQYEDGTEFTQKRADGFLCVNQKDQGQLKRVTLDMLMCVLNPDQIVQLTSAREVINGVTGTGAIFTDSLLSTHTSVEVWQQVAGRNACNANGVQQYVYWAFPHTVNWQVGDWTVENAAAQWDMKGETMSAGTTWGSLPTVLPPSGYLTGGSFAPGDHFGYNVTTVAPPANTSGAVVLV